MSSSDSSVKVGEKKRNGRTSKAKKAEEKPKQKHNKHPALPAYYPLDDGPDIELRSGRYKPRDLLNYSVKSFWHREDADLSGRQENARKGFGSRFREPRAQFDCKAEGVDDRQLQAAKDCVNDLKRYIDEFFFFGQLRTQLDLDAGVDVVKPTASGSIKEGWNGFTELRAGRCRLRINVGTGDQMYPLLSIVETLVHEMAHAYLMVFSDQKCEVCNKDRVNTDGLPGDGHGPVFLQLHRIMVTTIRKWDGELKSLAEEDCPGNSEASRSARAMAREAYRDLPWKEKDEFYRAPRAGSSTNLITISSAGRVSVKAALREKALEGEDQVRLKKFREQQLDVLAEKMMQAL